jgi:hypothetical protein
VLYLAIPAHNEVATIGVLLWRLRTVLAEFPREYEVVVYDDASTDDTAMVAEQYERAMPVSVLRGTTRLGYAGSVDALLRHIAAQTRYPRRDAVLLLQGDFTDPPGIVPEFARRFEGGADLVVGERLTVADAPTAVKRLFKYGHWVMRPFVNVEGVKDLTATMRLVRISALREALRVAGSAPLVSGDSWTANTDLLLTLAPHARRVESVPMEPTYGVRMRDTRRVAMTDALGVLKWAWGARGRRAVVGSSAPEGGAPDDRRGPRAGGKRRDEAPELSVERLREKVRERDGSRGIDGEPAPDPRRRRPRERDTETERPARGEARPETRPERTERPARGDKPERPERPERLPRGERPARDGGEKGRSPRGERAGEARSPRRREQPPAFADATLELDDPFAAPVRREPRPLSDDVFTDERVSSTAAEPADTLGVTPAPEVAEREASATLPVRDGKPRAEPADIEGDDNTDDTDDESNDEGGEEGDGGTVDADDQPARKRRRNRRSRRGRRKKEGGAEGVESGGGTEGESAEDGEPARAAPSRETDDEVRFFPGDHIDGEPVRPRRPRKAASDEEAPEGEGDSGADDGDDGDDDEAGGIESMAEGAVRPRRRGRRGRRGGARRSRGRKDKGEGDGSGDGPGDAPDAPPAGDE